MSDPTDNPPRGVTNLRIKFRSASLDEFIARYAVDVSRGGIFIRTREPLSVGSRLKLDFQLLDAAPLLDGEGTVVWIRKPDPARPEVAPGMGVRFDRLSPESDERLAQILAAKERLGQTGKVLGMSGTGGGMAVRRPTGTFPTVNPSAAPSPSPAEPAAGSTEGQATAPAAEGPRPSSPFATLARPAAGFGRPRPTTGGVSPLRSAPVPSSVFEPPTADDIDKALAMLEDKAGPIPTTQPPSAKAAEPRQNRRPPSATKSPTSPPAVAERIEDSEGRRTARTTAPPTSSIATTPSPKHARPCCRRAAPPTHRAAPPTISRSPPICSISRRRKRAGHAEARDAAHDDDEDDDDEATLAASPAAFATAEKLLGGVTGAPDRLAPAGAETASAASGSEGPSALGDSSRRDVTLAGRQSERRAPSPRARPRAKRSAPAKLGSSEPTKLTNRPRKGGKWAIALLVLAAIGGGAYALRGRSGTPARPQEARRAARPELLRPRPTRERPR